MRKLANPARCCCDDSPPCKDGPWICFTSGIACCTLPADVTWEVSGPDGPLGTCTATDSGSGATCCFDLNGVAPGTALTWTQTCAGLPAKSGTATAPACGQTVFAGATYALTDLYASLTLTDPLGNAITLSASGCDFVGSHYYPDACASGVGITITYRYASCTPCGLASTTCSLYASATPDNPYVTRCSGDACLDAYLGTSAQPSCYTVASRDRSCPPMLQHWVLSYVLDYALACAPFLPFAPAPTIEFTLTP